MAATSQNKEKFENKESLCNKVTLKVKHIRLLLTNIITQRRHENIMIKLVDIKKYKDIITCSAFVEDSSTAFCLEYNIKGDFFNTCSLPKGYEWCLSHIAHAKRFIRSLVEINDCPKEKIIMWY